MRPGPSAFDAVLAGATPEVQGDSSCLGIRAPTLTVTHLDLVERPGTDGHGADAGWAQSKTPITRDRRLRLQDLIGLDYCWLRGLDSLFGDPPQVRSVRYSDFAEDVVQRVHKGAADTFQRAGEAKTQHSPGTATEPRLG